MGWSNWVKIPRLKKVIEISRHANKDINYSYMLAEDLANTTMSVSERTLDEVTVGDITMLIDYWQKSFTLLITNSDEHLILWLNSMDWDYEVINEHIFDERKDKGEFKEYEIIKQIIT